MSEIARQARELFEEEREGCSSLGEVSGRHPDVGRVVDEYLRSEKFTAAAGKSWEELQEENEGRLQVIVRDESVQPLGTGKAKPRTRYLIRDSRDKMGVRDFLGSRADLIVMIDHQK